MVKRTHPKFIRKPRTVSPLDSVSLLESLFSTLNACIAYIDLDHHFIQINQTYAQACGRDDSEFSGKPVFSLFPDAESEYAPLFTRIQETGTPYFGNRCEFPFIFGDQQAHGSWDWSVQLLKGVDNRAQGFLLVAVDNTAFYKAQDEIQESRLLFEHLFESDPDGNVLVDEKGTILSINRTAETDFGFTREELIGRSIETLIPPRYRRSHVDERARYTKEPHLRPMGHGRELYARRKDGSEFPCDVKLSPLKTDRGLLVLAVVRDTTSLHQMENELAEVQRRLLQSLETERLRLAQDLHDGPLQDLYGATYRLQGIEQLMEYGTARSDLKDIQLTLSTVIDNLRETSSELRPAALVPFGLERAIASHAERFKKSHPELIMHLELMRDGKILPEHVRLALYRIYQNLLSNVVRHARASQVWIRLQIDAEQVVLEVQDDGIGFVMPQRYIDLARKGHMGLVGASERAEAIGGHVSVETAPDKGTLVRTVVSLIEIPKE